MQDWLVENNRVATGRAVNSLSIHITRQVQPGRTLRKSRNLAKTLGYSESAEAARLNTQLDKLDIGLVTGVIKAAPHFSYALQGRGAGARPPQGAIEAWMQAKGVEPQMRSMRDSAYLIARKIGAEGTNPPHFDEAIATQMVKFSSRKLAHAIAGPVSELVGKSLVSRALSVFDDPSLAGVMDAIYQKEGRKSGDWRKDVEDLKKMGKDAAATAAWTAAESFYKGYQDGE
jgi:hypothetical protein